MFRAARCLALALAPGVLGAPSGAWAGSLAAVSMGPTAGGLGGSPAGVPGGAARPASPAADPPAPRAPDPPAPRAPDPKDGPDVDLTLVIEDAEVRLVAVANLAFVDALTEVERAAPAALDAVERERAREALFALFADGAELAVDGVAVPPLDADFDFDAGDAALFAHFPAFGARAVAATRTTLRYPCKTPPRSVALVWDLFPPDVTKPGLPPLEVVCRVVGGGLTDIARLSAREPAYTWHRPAEGSSHLAPVPELERLPERELPWGLALGTLVAAALAWRGPRPLRALAGPIAVLAAALTAVRAREGPAVRLPTADEARAVFEPLHTNIYRAFDYTAQDDVYDALAASVDGALLARLYDEVYRGLVMQEEGGAVSQVEAVNHMALAVQSIGLAPDSAAPAFTVDASWEVAGAVYHWGHAHFRTNAYRAEYTVAATERGWRIIASRMLEQRRVDARPEEPQGAETNR